MSTIHEWQNTASDFASDDYIGVDGENLGSRKMSKDSLLRLTSQNAIKNIVPEFSSANTYVVGNLVTKDGTLYKCTTAHSGNWNSQHFTEASINDEFVRQLSIASEFASNVATVKNKLYWYNNNLYICNVAYTGTWNSDNFTAATLGDLVTIYGLTTATESDLVAGSNLLIMTADGPKSLPGNTLSKSSEQAALITYTQNVAQLLREETGLRKANESSYRSYSTMKFYEDASKASQVITDGYFDGSGNWIEAEGFTSLVFAANDFTTFVYFESQDVYRQLCVFDGIVDAAHFVAKYRSSDGTLPHVATPLAILPGQIFVIGNTHNSTFDFTFYTTWDGSVVFTEHAVENMETQIESFVESIAANKATTAKNEAIRIEDGSRNAEKVSQRVFNENLFFTDANKASQVITGGYFDGSGNWIEASGYTNNLYGAKDYTVKVYFTFAVGGVYKQISVFEGSATSANFIARYRSSDNDLPSSENPLVILPGQIFVISGGLNSTSDFSYFTTWNGEVEFTSNAVTKMLEQGTQGIEVIVDDEIDKNTFDITTGLTITRNSKLVQVMDGYYGDSYGGLAENTNYISYIYDVSENTTLYVRPTTASYLSVSVTNKEMNSGVRYRQKASSPSEYDLPTEENPISVVAGKRLIISESKSVIDNWNVVLPEEKWRSSFNNRVPLAQSHINQVLAQVADDRILVKYINDAGVESSTERLEVYVPTKVGYCRYDFLHNVTTERNCDVWRVAYAYAVDASMQSRFALTRSGEWECAIRLENRDDFSGGYSHGDEMLVGDVVFLMDGKSVALSELADGVRCGEFKCVTKTNLYDPDDHETVFGIHGCEHTFTKEGLRLRQSVDWQGTYNIVSTYMAMNLPLKTVTSKYYTDTIVYTQTIPDPVSLLVHNAKSVCLFDSTSGVENNFTLGRDYPVDNPLLYITDNASTYNKCYFVINLSTPKEVTSGTNWKTESFVDFKIGK